MAQGNEIDWRLKAMRSSDLNKIKYKPPKPLSQKQKEQLATMLLRFRDTQLNKNPLLGLHINATVEILRWGKLNAK